MKIISFECNHKIPTCKQCKHNECYDIRGGKGNKVLMKNVNVCFQSPSVKNGSIPFERITNQDIVCSNFERIDLDDNNYIQIVFHKDSKNWHIVKVMDNGSWSTVYPVSVQLQKVINKQIEELGW